MWCIVPHMYLKCEYCGDASNQVRTMYDTTYCKTCGMKLTSFNGAASLGTGKPRAGTPVLNDIIIEAKDMWGGHSANLHSGNGNCHCGRCGHMFARTCADNIPGCRCC